MSPSPSSTPLTRCRGRGRPREFDLEQVLDRAIQVFSERGYHGTSITDLVQATHLTQGSLYKAFQDKEAIFVAALERYRSVRAQQLHAAMGTEGTGLARLRRALAFYAAASQGQPGRTGCLVVGSLAALATFPEPVAQHIRAALARHAALLAAVIRQGQHDGSIAAQVDADASAHLLLCLVQGMRIVGKADAHHPAMAQVVDAALKTLA